jgi:hypothetical protein
VEKIKRFSLATHEGAYETWPLQTALYFDGRATGTSIPGFVIEAQYSCGDTYLIITSWDCPYEESNEFLLLDLDFRQVARQQLGAWYDSFLLERHTCVAPDTLELEYVGGLRYALSIKRDHSMWQRKPRLNLRRLAT